jgi:hypothetical protein
MQLSSLALQKEELICERCPIPQRQDYVDRLIESLSGKVQKARRHKNRRIRWRAHAAYVLMGMPGANGHADSRETKGTGKALEASHG